MTRSNTRVAVFYPWTGLPALDRGSARRVVPLINLFADRYSEVKVLSPGNHEPVVQANVEYLFQKPSAMEQLLLRAAHWFYDGLLHHFSRGLISPRERRQWWHYLSVRLQPSLQK